MYNITRFDKFNVIVEESELNVGINPVSEIIYGNGITRALIHFDISRLREMVNDKTFPDIKKLKHTLFIKNCGSIDYAQLHAQYPSEFNDTHKLRATSFDLILFLVPMQFDGGKGFDYSLNYFNRSFIKSHEIEMDGRKLTSKDGCNWYQARNGYEWAYPGVYTNEFLSREYDKFSAGYNSVIIGRQHFDVGNEDLCVDITDTVNKFIKGDLENYGIGIAFSPMTELKQLPNAQEYVGFFTHKTNTFFEPSLLTKYEDVLSDDRANFCLGKTNRLFLYTNIDGRLENLDEIPTCKIDENEYKVHQFSKGIYYIELKLTKKDGFEPETMYYDTWSNLKYKGDDIEDVELYFTTKPSKIAFNVGSEIEKKPSYVLEASGIKDDEKVNQGDTRKINFICRVPYTRDQNQLVDKMEMRLYVKDGESELDVIPFDSVSKSYLENFYILDTMPLVPGEYHVDIKLSYNMETRVHKDVLHFFVENNVTKRYW